MSADLSPLELLRLKRELAEEARRGLPGESASRARSDPHARREPRPCGLTVHTGTGCYRGCLYCYVRDMGLTEARPYPLTGPELRLAVLLNPFYVPGRTQLALGSITEPFLPETRGRTLEYLDALRDLGMVQISTKGPMGDPSPLEGVSVLVSACTLRGELEPLAPPVGERMEELRRAAEVTHACLFLRPIIPGEDQSPLLEMASGSSGVVLGGLRVTAGILERLSRVMDVSEILRRLRRPPRGREQVPVDCSDLKRRLAGEARRAGLTPYPAACSANAAAHGVGCRACSMGPCGPEPPEVDPGELERLLEELGCRPRSVEVLPGSVRASVGARPRLALHWLRAVSLRRVRVTPLRRPSSRP